MAGATDESEYLQSCLREAKTLRMIAHRSRSEDDRAFYCNAATLFETRAAEISARLASYEHADVDPVDIVPAHEPAEAPRLS